jgi:hypothetical protein
MVAQTAVPAAIAGQRTFSHFSTFTLKPRDVLRSSLPLCFRKLRAARLGERDAKLSVRQGAWRQLVPSRRVRGREKARHRWHVSCLER